MIIEGVNVLSIAVAGLVAGYAMAWVGYWMEGFLKLPRVDLSEAGFIYLDEDGPSRWWIGMLTHQIDSVIFTPPHMIANLLLHLVYGFVLGALYVPPR